MSTKYKANPTEDAYFITITVVGWVDVFTRLSQRNDIINALAHCQTMAWKFIGVLDLFRSGHGLQIRAI